MQKFFLYNTLTRRVEEFKPLNPPKVKMYACGPTVYDYTHIGHIRTYISIDTLRRALEEFGFKPLHVMNITDVGHLTDDADEGEDKLEKGAKKRKKTVWETAKFFSDYFFYTIDQVNIKKPHIICRATDHIQQMIELIQKLEQKGYIYETDQAVYFSVKKFKEYGKLSKQALSEKKTAVREEVKTDPEKKHPADFALWFKKKGRFANHTMHWDSPWGQGFPGWHIECSAMSMKYLGETIDIHIGGEDHIPVHHENEIAQSEAATGKKFVRYWLHAAHLLVEGQKMSKSLGNFYTIDDIKKRGFQPVSLRLLFLNSHYRQQMNFTFKALESSEKAFKRLKEKIQELLFIIKYLENPNPQKKENKKAKEVFEKFRNHISNDLNLPKALSEFWTMVDMPIDPAKKLETIYKMDRILGLNLDKIKAVDLSDELKALLKKRKDYKKRKEFAKADALRKKLEEKGLKIKDTPQGQILIEK